MDKLLDPSASLMLLCPPQISLSQRISSLRQSLFGISDITNLDYDATFRKDGLYLYNSNAELVHHTPKSPDDSSWTLPVQRPSALANAVISLPSDKKYVRFSLKKVRAMMSVLNCVCSIIRARRITMVLG